MKHNGRKFKILDPIKISFSVCMIAVLAVSFGAFILPKKQQQVKAVSEKELSIAQKAEELFEFESIPKVYLTTQEEIINKGEYKDLSIKITDEKVADNNYELNGEIKPRGNSTYAIGKKYGPMPYKIKLDEKADLLGMGKHKKWCLLANFIDRSYVKQFISFASARLMTDEKYFQPKAKYVEVYMNDEYKGLYLLTESIEEDDNSLDIEVDLDEYAEDVPFLLEVNEIDEDTATEFPAPLTLAYPKSMSDMSEAQATNVVNFVSKIYSDIKKKVPLDDLDINIDSFVDQYVYCYVFSDISCYYGPSQYVVRYKGEDKLTAGPLWDFDSNLIANSTEYRFLGDLDYNPLFQGLISYDGFREKLTNRLKEYRNDYFKVIGNEIGKLRRNEELRNAVERSEKKYDTWNGTFEWFNTGGDYTNRKVLSLKSLDEHIQYIEDYLFGGKYFETGRLDWLEYSDDPWGFTTSTSDF